MKAIKPRPVGRPRKEATEIVYVRMPQALMKRIRAKASIDKSEISKTISTILENGLNGK